MDETRKALHLSVGGGSAVGDCARGSQNGGLRLGFGAAYLTLQKKNRAAEIITYIAIFTFGSTAFVKFTSAALFPRFGVTPDTVFPFLSERVVLLGAATLELVVVSLLLHFRSNARVKMLVVAWLSGLFLAYRLATRILSDTNATCPCLGGFGNVLSLKGLPISQTLFVLLLALSVSSTTLLFWLGKEPP